MPRMRLEYTQWRLPFRPELFEPGTAIPEKKTQVFEAADAEGISTQVESFLTDGSVQCGDRLYRRSRISLREIRLPTPIPQPRPEFIPADEYA